MLDLRQGGWILAILFMLVVVPLSFGDERNAHLIEAASRGDTESAKFWLRKGANIHAVHDLYGHTALMQAAWFGHLDTVKYLVGQGALVNAKGNKMVGGTPLTLAAAGGHIRVVEFLLQRGALINAPDEIGLTALMCAGAAGFNDTLKYLIDQGADVNAKDRRGRTALMLAASHGHAAVVQVLIEHGAHREWKDNDGNTALDLTPEGATKVIELLKGK